MSGGVAKADFEDAADDDDAEQYEIPDDLAASHTGKTATNYGVTIDVLKRLTADSLEIFGQVSYRWHRFLQLIAQPSAPATPSLRESVPLTSRGRPRPSGPRCCPWRGQTRVRRTSLS